AELHIARCRKSDRRRARCQPRDDPHGSVVLELPGSPRPRVSRRARADRLALLHQLGGVEAEAEGNVISSLRANGSARMRGPMINSARQSRVIAKELDCFVARNDVCN